MVWDGNKVRITWRHILKVGKKLMIESLKEKVIVFWENMNLLGRSANGELNNGRAPGEYRFPRETLKYDWEVVGKHVCDFRKISLTILRVRDYWKVAVVGEGWVRVVRV